MRFWARIRNWSHRECVKPSCCVTVVSAKHLSESHFRGKGKCLYWLHLFMWQHAWLLKRCQITLGNPTRRSPSERWGSQCMHAGKTPVTTTTSLTKSHLPWFSKHLSYHSRRGCIWTKQNVKKHELHWPNGHLKLFFEQLLHCWVISIWITACVKILRVQEVICTGSEILPLKQLRCFVQAWCKEPTLKLAISSTSRLAFLRKLCHSIIPVIHQGEQIAPSRQAGRVSCS